MQSTYNPVVHRVNQVIQFRGIHGDEPMPKPYDVLLKYERPPQALVDKSQPALNAVIKKGDVKKGNVLSAMYSAIANICSASTTKIQAPPRARKTTIWARHRRSTTQRAEEAAYQRRERYSRIQAATRPE